MNREEKVREDETSLGLARGENKIALAELGRVNLWFIRLRWLVPPAVIAASCVGAVLGFEFPLLAMMAAAASILAYNVLLKIIGAGVGKGEPDGKRILSFAHLQVGLDYAAMFALIHYTGGVASPLLFFFIFHVIFAAILLPPRSAYLFAGLAASGTAVLHVMERGGVLAGHALTYKGVEMGPSGGDAFALVEIGFFTATLIVTAYSANSVVAALRKRVTDLARATRKVREINDKLRSLYLMTEAVLSARSINEVLQVLADELAKVMVVKGASLKLLSEDGKRLAYAASFGLPPGLLEKEIEVEKSPVNKRVLKGESHIAEDIRSGEAFQFREVLAEAGVRSALFVPIKSGDEILGVLGAYGERTGEFGKDHLEFFQLAAGLAGIALANARAYETIGRHSEERARFMLRVAHNLRAPLAAIISMLEVLRDGSLGDLGPDQSEYLRRVDRRARTMLELVSELLDLSRSKSELKRAEKKPLDPEWLAGRLERTFHDEALEKGLEFEVRVEPGTPSPLGDSEAIERALENLVSNSVKYTPAGKRVKAIFSPSEKGTRIEVIDEGIGIPSAQKHMVFTEFFRADNAKAEREMGTGLGLAIVREIVKAHGGEISFRTEEGKGTTFTVVLPAGEDKE